MKKAGMRILLAITTLFAAFTIGFFLGRNADKTAVQVSVPASLQTVPTETEEPETEPEEVTQAVTFPFDINSATAEEFTALPGIGDVLAGRILAYREENGSFAHVEELMNVEGIGEGKMEDILELVTIGG